MHASGTTFASDTVSLPEVNDVTKANGLVIKLYYWISPFCGGGGNPGCVKSVTDHALVTFKYYLDEWYPLKGRRAPPCCRNNTYAAEIPHAARPRTRCRLHRGARRGRVDRRPRHLCDLHELDEREQHDCQRHAFVDLAPFNRLGTGASPIAAGDTMQRAIDLSYSGSISFGSATLTTNATTSSSLDTDATDGLQIAIDRCSQAWTESGPPYTYTCSGSTSPCSPRAR